MITYNQKIKIGDNVTDIMKLPCVLMCIKHNDKLGHTWLVYYIYCDNQVEMAEKNDWLCKDTKGVWHVLSDCEIEHP